MKIKVISDMHLNIKGHGDNDFLVEDTKFINYMKETCENYDHLILNGDIFDTWESKKWLDYVNTFNEIVKDRIFIALEIFKSLIDKKIIYVVGNHDAIVKEKN